ARGDAGTVAAHVAELREHAPQTVAGYLAMARATADRALAHGLLKPELAEDLLGVLADGGDGGRGATGTGGGPEGGNR
ncbi:oxidoreductase, partial [Streptomyces sp. SID10115]|nr:oxidoreductase [Streptomyces sp. SID10115]